jgi:hypothetical protein
MNQQETEACILETAEGLMSLLQALVLALAKQGKLDTGEYARLLLDMRQRMVEPGSYQDVLFQRMLQMLVEGDPQVLVRRWDMHAVPTEPSSGLDP